MRGLWVIKVRDEIIEKDAKGKPLKVRTAKGIQDYEIVGDMVRVHFVDANYVLHVIDIPRDEFAEEKLTGEINKIIQQQTAESEIAKIISRVKKKIKL